jgi:membrane-associated phospholipid phosphatase
MRLEKQLAEDPAQPVPASRRPLLLRWGLVPVWLIALALLIFALTTADVMHGGALTRFDHDVARRMLNLDLRNRPWPKRLVYLLTLPGQRGTVLIFTVPSVLYLCWRGRSISPALRYAVALIVMTVVVYAIKDWAARPAPVFNLRNPAEPQSYPSGHVANALLAWGVVWWSAREVDPRMLLTRALNIVRLLGPALVVIGMTLLDYHWISDFIGGIAIAIVLLAPVTVSMWSRWCAPIDRQIWRDRSGTATDARTDTATDVEVDVVGE